jgi:hypothetical protein
VEGREFDCCEVRGGRELASVEESVDKFHGMVEGFPNAIGDFPPVVEENLAFS